MTLGVAARSVQVACWKLRTEKMRISCVTGRRAVVCHWFQGKIAMAARCFPYIRRLMVGNLRHTTRRRSLSREMQLEVTASGAIH